MPGARAAHRHPARALLLDALGTLVALEPPGPHLIDELGRRFGARITTAAAERAVQAEIAYYRAHLDEGRDAASVAALRHRCAEVIRRELTDEPAVRRQDPDSLTAALLASLRFHVFDDVASALAAARRCEMRLVVVSNWDYSLHDVLARLRVAPMVDGILTSAEVGARKPAREIFDRALDLAGVAAQDAMHVGDSLTEDVAGARAAGILPVLIDRVGVPPATVRVIRRRVESPSPTGVQVIRRPGGVPRAAGVRVIRTLAELAPLATYPGER